MTAGQTNVLCREAEALHSTSLRSTAPFPPDIISSWPCARRPPCRYCRYYRINRQLVYSTSFLFFIVFYLFFVVPSTLIPVCISIAETFWLWRELHAECFLKLRVFVIRLRESFKTLKANRCLNILYSTTGEVELALRNKSSSNLHYALFYHVFKWFDIVYMI